MRTIDATNRFSRPRFAIHALIAPLLVAFMIWGVIPVVQKQFLSFINPEIREEL